jgi:hypothetical protein
LARAQTLALRLHAAEVSPEHWLAALLEDEDCAATRAVLHAFADPETIGAEVLALCEGIMVVGSGQTLPFSMRSVEALRAARSAACGRRAPRVAPSDLFQAAFTHLPAPAAERLADFAASIRFLGRPEEVEDGAPLAPAGPLFRGFSSEALRGLGWSAKVASQLGRDAITPVHLLAGTLEACASLRQELGLSSTRLRLATTGADEDDTPLPSRPIPRSAELQRLLCELPEGAQTLDVLAWLLGHGSSEVCALLLRQKVTSALVESCRGVHADPGQARGMGP